jgi:hypothetical protein
VVFRPARSIQRWFDHKWGVTKFRHAWVKCHIASGVKSNAVTAVWILGNDAVDCPQFAPLVKETRHTSTVSEVSAD